MLVRGLLAAGLLLAVSASGVAAEPGKGRGNARGHDKQQASNSNSNSDLLTQLSSGQATVVVTLPGASATSATVECTSVPSGWANELNDSDWISPIASCTSDQAAGQYRYDVTFNVPSGTTGLSLSGSVLADDSVVSVVLNGHGLTLSGSGAFSSPSTFETSDQGFFLSGTNTLSITVNNASGATGLDFRVRVRSDDAPDADDDAVDGNKADNHGQCVSEVAHSTPPGPGHGEAVSEAAHNCA
jgi:hypothetical protein